MRKQFAILLAGLSGFGLFLGGVYWQSQTPRTSGKSPYVPEDAALALIDVLGDNDQIKSGSLTAECLSAKVDGVTDQYEILRSKIYNNPGTTHYFNGLYVTMMPTGRRPMFQVRFPDRKYCAPFAEAYRSCYAAIPKETDFDKLVLPSGRCIKEVAKTMNIREDWSGLIELIEPKAPSSVPSP